MDALIQKTNSFLAQKKKNIVDLVIELTESGKLQWFLNSKFTYKSNIPSSSLSIVVQTDLLEIVKRVSVGYEYTEISISIDPENYDCVRDCIVQSIATENEKIELKNLDSVLEILTDLSAQDL